MDEYKWFNVYFTDKNPKKLEVIIYRDNIELAKEFALEILRGKYCSNRPIEIIGYDGSNFTGKTLS